MPWPPGKGDPGIVSSSPWGLPGKVGERSPRRPGAELAAAGGRGSGERGRGFGVRGSAGGRGGKTCAPLCLAGRLSWYVGSPTSGWAACVSGCRGIFHGGMAGLRVGVPHSCFPGPRPGKFRSCVAVAAAEVVLGDHREHSRSTNRHSKSFHLLCLTVGKDLALALHCLRFPRYSREWLFWQSRKDLAQVMVAENFKIQQQVNCTEFNVTISHMSGSQKQ